MKTRSAFVLVTSLAFAVFAVLSGQALAAAASAANKVHVAGSDVVVIQIAPPDVAPTPVVLLSTTVKTSDKADLLVEFNAECFLTVNDADFLSVSEFNNFDSDFDSFDLRVLVWVEIDGVPVPVDPDAAATIANSSVNFCDRSSFETKDLFLSADFVSLSINEFVEETTSSANSFRWFAFDLGNKPNPHTVDVLATLTASSFSTVEGSIQAAVGKRTMVSTPLNNLITP